MKQSRKENFKGREPDVRDRWMVSYADLVTLLLALFIVLYAASDKQRAAAVASSFKAEYASGDGILDGKSDKDKQSLAESILSEPLLVQHSKLTKTKTEITLSLNEAAVFEPGSSDVSPESVETIKLLASKLAAANGRIRIEGHTDSLPISNQRFRSNWELSTSRAASVLMLLVQHGVPPERLSASGYGGFRPVAENSTTEGRRLNRRVDVVVEQR